MASRMSAPELAAVVDPVLAVTSGSVLAHEKLGSNLAFEAQFGAGDVGLGGRGPKHRTHLASRPGRTQRD